MQFNSHEERVAAIRAASTQLGIKYGDLKFAEQMLRETTQSFIAGGQPEKGPTVLPETKPVPEKVEVKKTPAKKAPAKKATAKKVEPAVEPEVSTETTAVQVTVETEPEIDPDAVPEVAAEAGECPIVDTTGLRTYMLERYNEAGKTLESMNALKAALTEATGCVQAVDVPEDKLAIAYNAIKNCEV